MRVNKFGVGVVGLLLLGALALQQNACSLALSFDPDGLKCDPARREIGTPGSGVFGTNFCYQGYTCLNNVCVRDRSHDEGEPCSQAIQCQEGQTCPIDLLDRTCRGQGGCKTCLKTCSTVASGEPYYQDQACEAGFYCGAFLNGLVEDSSSTPLPACAPSDSCQPGTACTSGGNAGGVCVAISATANACMTRCEVNWTPGTPPTYGDSCAENDGAQPRSCAIVGKPGSRQFVCLRVGNKPEGQTCNIVSSPCLKGNVCRNGLCRQFCQRGTGQASCPVNQTCCAFDQMDPGLGGASGQATLNGFCAPQNECPP